jgi:hypothetical protein
MFIPSQRRALHRRFSFEECAATCHRHIACRGCEASDASCVSSLCERVCEKCGWYGCCYCAVEEITLELRRACRWMVLGSAITFACGNSAPNDDETIVTNAIVASQFESNFASALCGEMSACCASNLLPFDPNGCTAAATTMIEHELTLPAIAIGAQYNPSAAAACIQAVAAAASACDDTNGVASWESACAGVYTGTKAPGESCASTADCAPAPALASVTCLAWKFTATNPDAGTSSGSGQTCQVLMPGQAGAPCENPYNAPPSATLYNCGSDPSQLFSCDDQSETCIAKVAAGAACEQTSDCVSGDYCGYDDDGIAMCSVRAAIGASCVSNDGYEIECMSGSYCDYAVATCAPLLGPGASCNEDSDCAGYCVDERCVSSALAQSPICGG